jgi:hypothetical protein
MSLLLEKEATKIVIKAVGIDFPMLIHEAVKGIYLFLQSGAIKKDKETAKIIKKATSSFTDEAQDFRYGPPALQMLVNFVNKFSESSEYKRLDTRVFTILAYDKQGVKEELEKAKITVKEAKEKATKTGDINDEYAVDDAEFLVEFLEKRLKVVRTDDQFLEITNSIFSCFDLQGGQFVLNEDKFNNSHAKDEIKKIIKYIVDDIEEAKKEAEEYRKAMEDWNREQKEREEEESWRSQHKEEGETKELSGEEESDIDSLIRKTAEKEQDYSNMTPREINNLIDQALDEGDFEKVKMLSGYLPKESAQIYLRELERINELHSKRNR